MSGRTGRPARRLVIDWALIEQRRIAAGMTHAQLAERVGAGAVTGPTRLWTDRDHDSVPLGLLERLCHVLDLHPTELFRAPTRAAQRRAEQPPVRAAGARPPGPGRGRNGAGDAAGWMGRRVHPTRAPTYFPAPRVVTSH